MTIPEILESYKTIAVVGISAKEGRPALYVPDYMRAQGYTIIPVNPTLTEWQGIKAYPDLKSIPASEKIEIVNIFRKPEEFHFLLPRIFSSGQARTGNKCL